MNVNYPAEFRRFATLLDDALDLLRDKATLLADAERDYRRQVAVEWQRVERQDTTAAEREAYVNAAASDARRVRDEADGMRQFALELVRSRRTAISALQSLMAVERSEAEFARTGPS